MKNTTKAMIMTLVGGTTVATAYVRKAYDKKAKELGYTYNKDTKQYELKHEGNLWDNISFSTSHMLDQYTMDQVREEASQKAGIALFSVSFVVGLVCGIINRTNR